MKWAYTIENMKTPSSKISLPLALALVIWAGCKKDQKPDCTPNQPAQLTFNGYIHPLMTSKCLGCHAAGGIVPTLETYAQVTVIVNDGRLKNVINGTGGYTRMPFQSDPLPDCDIEYISKWVDTGAPE